MSVGTPTIFQLGKLSNAISEINKGLGSTWTTASMYETNFRVSLTFPELDSSIESINSYSAKVIEYFGLNEDEMTCNVEQIYSSGRIEFAITSKDLRILITNR